MCAEHFFNAILAEDPLLMYSIIDNGSSEVYVCAVRRRLCAIHCEPALQALRTH